MLDAFAESTARLEELLKLATEEADSDRRDALAIEIRRLLDERERLKRTLRIQDPPQQP